MTHFSTRLASVALAFAALAPLSPTLADTAYPSYTKGDKLTANTQLVVRRGARPFSTAVNSIEACKEAARELHDTMLGSGSSRTTCQGEDGRSRARFYCEGGGDIRSGRGFIKSPVKCSPL